MKGKRIVGQIQKLTTSTGKRRDGSTWTKIAVLVDEKWAAAIAPKVVRQLRQFNENDNVALIVGEVVKNGRTYRDIYFAGAPFNGDSQAVVAYSGKLPEKVSEARQWADSNMKGHDQNVATSAVTIIEAELINCNEESDAVIRRSLGTMPADMAAILTTTHELSKYAVDTTSQDDSLDDWDDEDWT